MRFLAMHRVSEQSSAWDPSPEFIEAMGAFMQEAIEAGVLITAEGVHKSDRGARVRKHEGGSPVATDGPFSEAKEVVGGFALINAADKAEAVAWASRYADLFDEVEVEVREVFEFEEDAAAV